MPKIQLKSSELFYEVHGCGPVLVFVHGLTGNHLSWFHQMPKFTKKYRCLIYDQRYFGASQSVPPDSSDSFVDDLRELIDKVGDLRTFGSLASHGAET
ncbi:MAG: alpha/beta hydrolase [Dehalococcoidia bacterium]|nr:alpha/beta hydrolase [Dehalococcoidia bacterium]